MIFNIKKKESPKIGHERIRSSYCLIPLKFKKKIYWLHKVCIKEKYTKNYLTVAVDGGGWTEDGYKIMDVFVNKDDSLL